MALFKKQEKEPEVLPVRVDPTFGEAAGKRARLAARSGDASTVLSLFEAATDPHDREYLCYAALHGLSRAPWLENLPESFPDRPTTWLVRGVHGVFWAGQAIGNKLTPAVDPAALGVSRERLEQADRDLVQATRVLGDDPTAWSHLVASGTGLAMGFEEICNRFDEADSRAHWMYFAHHHMLHAACSRPGGSEETMFAFARDVLASAPEASPCLDLIAVAHIEKWREQRAGDAEVTMAAYLGGDEVFDEISVAAKRSVESTSFDDSRGAVRARNVLAMVFAQTGQVDRAREQFLRIGDRVTEYPWIYQNPDPGLAFARARRRVLGPESP